MSDNEFQGQGAGNRFGFKGLMSADDGLAGNPVSALPLHGMAIATTQTVSDDTLRSVIPNFLSGNNGGLEAASLPEAVLANANAAANWSKLQFGLGELFVEAQQAIGALQGEARTAGLSSFVSSNTLAPVASGFVAIDAAATGGDGAALLASLEALGLEGGASAGPLVSGRLPIDAIDDLAALEGVKFARPAYAASHVGSVTADDAPALQTDVISSAFGLDGTGLTIGILSDSFDTSITAATSYADDILSGDLPDDVLLIDDTFTAGTIDEGRAMAQLIHDIAPEAALQFHTAFGGQAVFAQGILDLAAAGSDIIVDDIIYFAEPMFQDGIIAQSVDMVAAMGIPYLSSAGNQDDGSYESAFDDSGETLAFGALTYRLHDFDPGTGVDTRLSASQLGPTTYTLQWDESFFSVDGTTGSTSDLALITLFPGTNTVIAVSDISNFGGDPVELVSLNGSGTFDFAIGTIDAPGNEPGLMKLTHFGSFGDFNEFDTNSSTSYGHNNAEGALSVGAAFNLQTPEFGVDPPELQSFSSKGGTPILFDTAGNRLAAPVIRDNVDFTSTDGGNNTFFGSDSAADPDSFPNFFGTSAAAPTAAAVIALLKQAFPAATTDQIEFALESTAIDITNRENGPAVGVGNDVTSGAGLIQADLAYAALQALFPAGELVFGADPMVSEGDAGATDVTFTINRINGSAGEVGVTVGFGPVSGAPNNADAADFVGGVLPAQQVVTFADGQTQETVTVQIQGDTLAELDEVFAATMLAGTETGGVSIAAAPDNQSTATILNDDNTAPVIDLNGPDTGIDNAANYTEQQPVLPVLAPLTVISDADGERIVSAQVQITGGYLTGQDTIGIGSGTDLTALGLAGNFDAGTGTYTLTREAEIGDVASDKADFQTALRNLDFASNSDDPGTTRTITWTVSDGTDNSAPATTTITITPVNDAPDVMANGVASSFRRDDPPVDLFETVVFDTIEAGQSITEIVLTVDGLLDLAGPNEFLTASGTDISLSDGTMASLAGGVSVSVVTIGSTATVTFSGSLAPEDAATLVDTLTYSNDSAAPTTGERIVTLTSISDDGGTDDGGADTAMPAGIVATINVAPNTPPEALASMVTALEDTPFVFGADDFGFDDPDAGDMLQVVRIDTLALDPDASLELDGSPVIAGQEIPIAEIGDLVFTPGTDENGTNYSSFTFSVRDGSAFSAAPATMTIDVTPVNDAPELDPRLPVTIDENTPVALDAFIVILDDNAQFDGGSLTVELEGGLQPGEFFGTANGPLMVGRTESFPSVLGGLSSYTVTALDATSFTLGNFTNLALNDLPGVLQNVAFNTGDDPAAGPREITFTFVDGGGMENGGQDTSTDSATLTVTPINDAPELTATGALATFREGEAAVDLFSDITADTIEAGQSITEIVLSVSGRLDGGGSEVLRLAGLPISLDSNDTTTIGVATVTTVVAGSNATVTFTGDFAPMTAANLIDTLDYINDSTDPSAGQRTFTITSITDDGGTANGGVDTSMPAILATVDVVPNTLPIGADNTVITNEDTDRAFEAVDFGFSDGDAGDLLQAVRIDTLALDPDATLELAGNPVSAGQVVPVADIGQLVFTPGLNENGLDYSSFTFSVSDGLDFDATARTMSVDVTPVNDAPTSSFVFVDINEDTSVGLGNVFSLAYSDIENDPLTSVRIDTLTIDDDATFELDGVAVSAGDVIPVAELPLLVFTPGLNENGLDYSSFTFSVNDGELFSVSPEELTFDVEPVNDAPMGTDTTLDTLVDTPITFEAADFGYSDVEDDPFTSVRIDTLEIDPDASLELDGNPVNALDVIAVADIPLLVFTPGAAEFGEDYSSFTFSVNDGDLFATSPNTLTIDVNPPNLAPIGVEDRYLVRGTGALAIAAEQGVLANDSDPDGDDLTASLVTDVSNGDLTLNPDGSFVYLADAGFSGTDTFTYVADDGDRTSDPVTVSIEVTGVNEGGGDGPAENLVADDDAYSVIADASFAVLAGAGVLINDEQGAGEELTATLVRGVINGELEFNADGSFTYTPDQGFVGTDSFDYFTSDGSRQSNVATVTLAIGAANAPLSLASPLADRTVDEDNPVSFTLPADAFTDADGDPLTFSATLAGGSALPAWLQFDPASRSFTGQPPLDFNGSLDIRVSASDGQTSVSDVFTLSVLPINDAPVFAPGTLTLDAIAGEATSLTTEASDVDGDTLVYTVSSPQQGTASYTGGVLTYTPFPDAAGSDIITLTASDPAGATATQTIEIAIDEDQPEAQSFVLVAPNGWVGAVGGNGLVIGNDAAQDVTVLSGEITLDPSFNGGGDVIRFTNPVEDHFIGRLGGSTAFITDNDGVFVAIPIGINGLTASFADASRTLLFEDGDYLFGDQVFGSAAEPVLSAANDSAAPLSDDPGAPAQVILLGDAPELTIGGDATIFGTGAADVITLADVASTIVLDPSFNQGGDTLVLPGAAADYTAVRTGGSTVLIEGLGSSVSIPMGVVGITLRFSDGDRQLVANGDGFVIGDQIIEETPVPLMVPPSEPVAMLEPLPEAALVLPSATPFDDGGGIGLFA